MNIRTGRMLDSNVEIYFILKIFGVSKEWWYRSEVKELEMKIKYDSELPLSQRLLK
jgi:hypothetical protein